MRAPQVRGQERLDATVRKAEQVLRVYGVATQLVQGATRLAQPALAVSDILSWARPRSAGLMHHRLNVAVARRDEHNTDRPATLKDALDETARAERLVVRVWSHNDEMLTGAHVECGQLGAGGFGRCEHRRQRNHP